MSFVLMFNRARWRGVLPWVVLGLCLTFTALNRSLHDRLFHRGILSAAEAARRPTEAPPKEVAALPTTVTLAGEKFRTAGVATEPARLEALPAELGVPGRIEANLDHQVQVRPRAAGVVRDVKVGLGQAVKKGDVLAVLDSPDVGSARLDLRARQRELATIRIEAAFKKEIAGNVATLILELRKNAEPQSIHRTYVERTLGAYRATLLSAYARYATSQREEEKTSGLFRQQIVGEHPMLVATHAREGAQAEFEAAVEQARFDASQQSLLAHQKVRQAESAVIDAAQRLRILGVPEDIEALLAQAGTVAADLAQSATEDVTACPVLAPFDGTIVSKTAVTSQKADMSDVLFTVADLSTVWVLVNIPESDFALLPALKQGTIRLSATAYPGKLFDAKLLSVGAQVDPTTRTVPMIAATPNPDGALKVGLFVRITLDTAVENKALTVPHAAVVEIEGRPGVFIAAGDGRTFNFRPVMLGRESKDRQVIASGLTLDDPVVTRGAFLLKSEMILKSQGEDE
jgi:cobalt-zinc-cadmium efflux system membrane fusion protein